MSQEHSAVVSVRYMIDDVDAAVAFYTNHLGFSLDVDSAPAFASVTRGNLRLLLSGEKSSGRRPMPDGTKPIPGGCWRSNTPHDIHPHPRLWGTFPRVLGHYCREIGLFGLETAVHKKTKIRNGSAHRRPSDMDISNPPFASPLK